MIGFTLDPLQAIKVICDADYNNKTNIGRKFFTIHDMQELYCRAVIKKVLQSLR